MQQVRRIESDLAAPAPNPLSKAPPAPRIQRPAARPVSNIVALPRGGAPALGGIAYPVPVRKRGGILVTLGNLWVLHRRLALRVFALLIVIAGAAGLYVFRDELSDASAVVAALASGQLAEAGLAIERIEIEGLALTRETDVAHALGISEGMTSIGFDAEAARQRIEEIPSVAEASVRKIYPDQLVVTISEKSPMARWRVDGAEMLIDSAGHPVARAGSDNADLMLVIGEGAGDDALPMINLMERYPDLTFNLAALNRVADRRWDLIFYSGLRVLLPETGVTDALSRLNDYQVAHQLLDRDVELIDMRVPQYVAVRPIEREETQSQ